MGYGNEEFKNNKVFVKLLGLKAEEKDAYFEVGKDKERANFIEGTLQGVEMGSYEYQGKPRETVNIMLSDNSVDLWFSIAMNKVGRSILNKLATVEKFGKIKMKAWTMEKDGKTSKGVMITNDGVKLEVKHDWDKQKELSRAVVDPETKEFIRYDYSKLDELLKSEIAGINERVLASNPF